MREDMGAMDPDLLRTFLAVRKHRSYTRAAEELFVTQPAVSRRVRRLEQALGTALFEQIGKSLHTTDAGETLAAEADRLLGATGRAIEAVRAHDRGGRGALRVGASTTPGFYLLPQALGRFHRAFPGVELHYVVQNSTRIEHQILRNELDLGFVGAHLASRELHLDPVGGDEVVCFSHPAHPLARRRNLSPAALVNELWVVREQGSATRRLFESWLASTDARMGRTIELNCPEAVKALVAAGVGISFMSLHGLRDEFRRGRLRRLRVRGLNLTRPIFAARHNDKRESPSMTALLAEVRRSLTASGAAGSAG